MQETIPESERYSVNAAQNVFCEAFSILKDLLVSPFPRLPTSPPDYSVPLDRHIRRPDHPLLPVRLHRLPPLHLLLHLRKYFPLIHHSSPLELLDFPKTTARSGTEGDKVARGAEIDGQFRRAGTEIGLSRPRSAFVIITCIFL